MARPRKLSTSDVLDAIRQTTAYRIFAIPPALEDVRRYLGVGSTRTIHRYLAELEQQGLVLREGQGRAGVRVIEQSQGRETP
jgi:DNA-binding IclR family transcriptional regulator